MKKPDGPCYKCQDRQPGCHGACERYEAYKAEAENYRQKIKAAAAHDNSYAAFSLTVKKDRERAKIKANRVMQKKGRRGR